jgi:hypothetical protein
MSFARAARVAAAVIVGALAGCTSVTAPADSVSGTYVLASASGPGPVSGILILTRQGYAERRVRFREPNGALSKEYLARGTITVNADNTVELELREMGVMASDPWRPQTRLDGATIEIRHSDAGEGATIVEVYRRK